MPSFALLVLITLFFLCLPSASATEVVVNKSVPLQEFTVDDIRSVFTMKKRTWPNGRSIQVFTLSDNHPLHKKFVKNILHLFPHQLRRIWDRLAYSGTGTTPIEVNSEQEMLERVSATPDAIGYLDNIAPHVGDIHALKYH